MVLFNSLVCSPSLLPEPQHLLRYFRWHLAYTLINNPSLIELRKSSASLSVDHKVVLSGGEARFVSADEEVRANTDAQLLPHIVEVRSAPNNHRYSPVDFEMKCESAEDSYKWSVKDNE